MLRSLLLYLLTGLSLLAQPWSGILSTSRAIDWSSAGAGTLPTRTTNCTNWFAGSGVPSAGTGVNGDYYWRTDNSTMYHKASGTWTADGHTSTADINTSISSCPDSQVVNFNAGTFTFTTGWSISQHNNVTIRGAGPLSTSIVFTSAATNANSNCTGLGAAICVQNNGGEYGGSWFESATWTAGYSQGTTSITLGATVVGNINTLRTGSLLILDQCDSGLSGGDACGTGSVTDNSNFWVCGAGGSGTCSQQGDNAQSGRSYGGVVKRAQNQQVKVVSCTGANSVACSSGTATAPYTVVITPGLYAPNWTSGQSPGAWWSQNLPIVGVGFENLTLDYSAITDTNFGAGIFFFNAYQCYVKNLRFINSISPLTSVHKSVWLYQSSKNTIRDSYFYGSSPSSEGYGVDTGSSSGDELVENNICQRVAACTINEGSVGSVYGYNYAVDAAYTGAGTAYNWQGIDVSHHSAEDHLNLWEGHEGIDMNADDIHGTGGMNTFFRVYLNGHDPVSRNCPGATCENKTQATFAFFAWATARYYHLIGSVLGTQSYHAHYKTTAASTSDCPSESPGSVTQLSVILLGYSDNGGSLFSNACTGQSFTLPNDLSVASTIMLWGNYAACTGDAACNAVRFVAGENGSGASTYPALSNPSSTLPSSFYLASKPSWWGTMPWPAVGPDVTGGNIANVGGHAYHNPAANCYLTILGGAVDGSSGVQAFDATTCYAATSAPTVTTTAASSIGFFTASGGGNVTADGGATVTARGTCIALTANPTIAGFCTSDSTGTGVFTSSLPPAGLILTPGTTYHIRGFGTNSVGTSYGSDMTFTTTAEPTLSFHR